MAALGPATVSSLRPVLQVCRRYAVTVLTPVVTAWLIYGDYSRTQRYKNSKAAQSE